MVCGDSVPVGQTPEPDIVVARNDHPNEKVAYELAERVYGELEARGFNVILETRPADPLTDTILEADGEGKMLGREDLEQAVDYRPGERWEGRVAEEYPDSIVLSLHNYPANADELPVETHNIGELDSDGWQQTRWYVDEARSDNYRFIEFLDSKGLTHVEIPAMYKTRLPEGTWDAVDRSIAGRDALKNLDTYMYDADVQKSREDGFLEGEVVDLIVEEVTEMV